MSNQTNPSDVNARRGLEEKLIEAAHSSQLSNWTNDHEHTMQDYAPAFNLTVAMGYCRLFGFTPRDKTLLAPLFPSMLEAALRGSFSTVKRLKDCLKTLEKDLEDSEIDDEMYEFAIRVFVARAELQAFRIAVSECFMAYEKADVHILEVLDSLRSTLDGVMEDLDEEIYQKKDFLAIVAETFWIENFVKDLPEDSWSPRPWWLTPEIVKIRQKQKKLIQRMEKEDGYIILEEVKKPGTET